MDFKYKGVRGGRGWAGEGVCGRRGWAGEGGVVGAAGKLEVGHTTQLYRLE